MTREIFVDASFWTALFFARDERHDHAENTWRAVNGERWATVTANWTLYETLTFLNSRGRHDLAVLALDFVSSSTEVVYIEEARLEKRGLEIFLRHPDKRWSVVDCASFACIEQRQSDYAASYDHDFQQVQNEFNFQLFSP